MYEIKVDTRHALIEVTLGGMMSVAEVGAYIGELRTAFIANRIGPDYALTIDVTRCPVQSQAMIETMRTHMGAMPKARAIAVVVGSSLAKMQVRRLFSQPYVRIVDTQAEGRAWVLNGVEPEHRSAVAAQ